ncbi:Uncharacterized protein M6B38_228230 [Iris pallida]|uniref:UBA domain-containing protein n=1 Tax=Iris pallida TaxID=29817 RepID=A0AAX6DSU9_IRIPA|nr:Uncharacterized protein M6B38_228230 [Iris pallida]
MSPASKSKSKDKSAAKMVKEHNKAAKSSVTPVNGGSGVAASAYDPVSGMFHTLESVPSASTPTSQSNGRFRTIDETEEHSGSSLGTAAEYDSVSNNDSCSGESEDQQKEKMVAGPTSRTEPIPGSDMDKREKIRQKNERKHQRQREKRAQELHERCCSYLTSRKLESLAQKLVAMGFTSEQATMALIQNEGRLEESALWLTEGGEESKQQAPINLDGVNPKINITDELARIADMELIFKCTKQEVERAVVACEGDLEKAEENLRTQKQEQTVAPQKSEESADHPMVSAGFHNNRLATSSQNSTGRAQLKGLAPAIGQQRRDERDLNNTKAAVTAGFAPVETANRNLLSLRKVQPKPDWTKPQAPSPLEKRWPNTSSIPSTPYSLASPLQVGAAHTKPEPRYVATSGSDVKANMAGGTLREPITMMQRSQPNVTRPNLPSTSIGLSASPPASSGWYPSSSNPVELMKLANGGLGQQLRNLAMNGSSSQQFYPQNHHQQFITGPVESNGMGWGASWSMQGTTTRSSSSSTSLAVPSSLGLFTGWGSTGPSSSSPVDWSTRGSMPQCDYTSIDWSLDSTPLPLPLSSIKGERLYDNSWHASYMTSKAARPLVSNGVCNSGLQDGGLMVDRPMPSAGSHEWTSPFGGKDLFRVPRQFVTSPSP